MLLRCQLQGLLKQLGYVVLLLGQVVLFHVHQCRRALQLGYRQRPALRWTGLILEIVFDHYEFVGLVRRRGSELNGLELVVSTVLQVLLGGDTLVAGFRGSLGRWRCLRVALAAVAALLLLANRLGLREL